MINGLLIKDYRKNILKDLGLRHITNSIQKLNFGKGSSFKDKNYLSRYLTYINDDWFKDLYCDEVKHYESLIFNKN